MYANFKMGGSHLVTYPPLDRFLDEHDHIQRINHLRANKGKWTFIFFISRNKTFVGQIKLFAGRGDTLESVVNFVQCKKRKTF